mgnify:FL=1
MTQAIGLASALVILAFVLVLYALLTVSIKRTLEGDTRGARGPLAMFGLLVLAALVSVATWADSAVGDAVSSLAWAFGSIRDFIGANPLSLICIGPVAFVILFTLVTPGARRWIGRSYMPLSALVLAVSFAGGAIYLVFQVAGGLGVLGLLVLIGLVVALGTRGLVFVPQLDDGLHVGEGAPSSILRIVGVKTRRNLHLARRFLGNLLPRIASRQGAPVIGIMVIIALAGWWYSGRSQASPENGVSVVVLGSPTPTSGISTPVNTPTSTPTIEVLRVVNTGDQGLLMRDQPGRSGKPIASLPEGTTLEIAGPEQTADDITWRQVKEKGGKVGWVAAQYLKVERIFGLVSVANTGGVGVNLRAEPSKTAKIIVLLKEGTELKVVGEDVLAEEMTWRNVKDDKDNVGWVSSQFLVPQGN